MDKKLKILERSFNMENNFIKSTEKYVVLESSIKELMDRADNTTMWQDKLYEKEYKHEGLTREQELLQVEKHWDTTISNTLRLHDEKFCQAVEKAIYDLIAEGETEHIAVKAKQRAMNSKVTAVLTIEDRNDGYQNAFIDFVYDAEKKDGEVYITDEKKMDEAIMKVKKKQYKYNQGKEDYEHVLIEKVELSIYAYSWRNAQSVMERAIKRVMREGFTYCFKQDKLVVPEEYAKKGAEGIREWRNLKASKNKNNNMEKRMLRGMLQEKRTKNLEQMQRLLWRFPVGKETRDWRIPNLTIYGNGNKSMAKKLVTQILGKKTDQELLNMTQEEVEKLYKEYWKGVLKKAIEQMDEVETFERV